jgi:YVTN family beta-propeller protein
VAVNTVTNRVYVANSGSDDVTVIEGATNATTTIVADAVPFDVAVNPVTNKIYVANRAGNVLTVIDGCNNSTTTRPAGTGPVSVAVDPRENKVYVADWDADSVVIIDGGGATSSMPTGHLPIAVAVIPDFYSVLIANNGSNDVTWTNGQQAFNYPAGAQPYALVVNPLTAHAYVSNNGDNTITEFDLVTAYGMNDTNHTLTAGSNVQGLAVNPVTGQVCVANYNDNNVTVFTEEPFADTRVRAEFDPLPGHSTPSSQPALTGIGVNRLSPNRNHMMGVAGCVNDMVSSGLNWNQVTSGGGTDSINWNWNWSRAYDSLLWGENYIYAAPFEMDAATTNNEGTGSPFVGNPVVYPVYRTLATGVDESPHTPLYAPQLALSVAPNPLSSGLAVLRYSLPEAGAARLSVYNVAGQAVLSRALSVGREASSVVLDLRHLSNGVYLVKLTSEDFAGIRKLVVQR